MTGSSLGMAIGSRWGSHVTRIRVSNAIVNTTGDNVTISHSIVIATGARIQALASGGPSPSSSAAVPRDGLDLFGGSRGRLPSSLSDASGQFELSDFRSLRGFRSL
jgi:hypothetical protein